MTTPPGNATRGMLAGYLLLGAIVLGGLVGAGVGALLGALAPLLGLGVLVGVVAGTAAVIVRYRDL